MQPLIRSRCWCPAAMHLNPLVNDLASHIRHRDLDHRDLGFCYLVPNGIHSVCSIKGE